MTTPTAQQQEHITSLEDMANTIKKVKINLKKCPKTRLTAGYIKTRLKTLEEYWETFKTEHEALMKCTPREQRGAMPYFLNEEFYNIEDLYITLSGDLADLLTQVEAICKDESYTSTSEGSSSLSKLPRIQLPTFSGRYEDWPSYQDLFKALVHNTNLSDVQKLNYLKTSVSGEAEILLRHIQITSNNYNEAWELLKRRFGNKKMIANSIMKRLFGQKRVSTQSATQIKALLDNTTECLNSLNNLQIKTDSWDPLIIFLVCQKLDIELLKEWEECSYKDNSDELPKWEELKKFLETKFRTLELVTPMTSYAKDKPSPHKSFHITTEEAENTSIQTAHASVAQQPACTYCNALGHYIYNCKEFGKQTTDQRRDFVKKNNLCYNCLIPNHNVFKCKQRTTCRICRGRHHSLLHKVKDAKVEEEEDREVSKQDITAHTHFSKKQTGQQVLLATAQVEVKTENGDIHILRALIDQGSEASFVSARVVDILGLRKNTINGVVSGLGEVNEVSIKHLVDLPLTSRFVKEEVINVKAYVLKTITTRLPTTQITMKWPQLQTIDLADPTYHTPGKVDILLGADIFCRIIEDGLMKMPDGIVAQKTSLGWILSGQRDVSVVKHNIVTMFTMVAEDNDLLRKFWEVETESYKKQKILTKEEEKCEEIYRQTTKRDNDRYTVHFPLKQSIKETVELCGETKQQAIRRLKGLERRFENNPTLKTEYSKVIEEYKEMGHMVKSDTPEEPYAIYLAHHAVIREDKDTTKTRIVFDASCKGSKGYSLNDTMMVGPVLQLDLRSQIIAWRMNRICVVGDIVKMYRQIRVTSDHTNLQRIVWRDNPTDELEVYNLTTVTFGTSSALYLAVRTLYQVADDQTLEYPETAPLIKTSFYIDDMMIGGDNIEATKKICKEMKTILERGGFQMQKWSSNSQEILETLQEGEITQNGIEIKLDKVIKILGLTWDRQDDAFEVKVNLPEMIQPVTKRSILSDVARLFDPFGWLSPVIIVAKMMIQKLWLCSLGWDDELPTNLIDEWLTFRKELIHLGNIQIPRWLKITMKNKAVELHGFADASTQAYAAVTYLRIIDDEGRVHVTLIAGRTRVAPLRQITVPRLELSAANLLAELVEDLVDILTIPRSKIFAWTDSNVVLSWLQSQPSRWRTFVANKVSNITRVIDNDRWNHVKSAENPADIATRGNNASDLASYELWWTGPEWLKQQTIEVNKCDISQTELEQKLSFHITMEVNEKPGKPIWEKFSTLTKMKRVLARARRVFMIKRKEILEKYLTTQELEDTLQLGISYYQHKVYKREIEEIVKDGRVKPRSPLNKLSPFLDEKGLLRVRGRLQNASIPEMTKHPIIIPSGQHITHLIINEAHTRTLHGGIQLMLAYVRTKYWVIGLKSAVRNCIRNCKTCIVDKGKVRNQFMGQLPAVRCNPHRAFQNSGVDYAGPVWIRTSKGRGHHATKAYICLFVCMATRAIHLEAVTDLTAQAFIAAFRRFVARRGPCMHLWSDNGSNFVGAAKELKTLFETKHNVALEIAETLANEGTTWHFIPPRMPTHGGLWEAGVQSAKKHLYRVNKDTKLTYEEMSTLLTQVEACLNSRPMCQIDNATETPLTPGHFLVGEPLISVPDLNYREQKTSLLTRWQLVQKMTQDFWRQWQSEYLNTLQQRYKWLAPVPSPAVGDVVIIKDEDLCPPQNGFWAE